MPSTSSRAQNLRETLQAMATCKARPTSSSLSKSVLQAVEARPSGRSRERRRGSQPQLAIRVVSRACSRSSRRSTNSAARSDMRTSSDIDLLLVRPADVEEDNEIWLGEIGELERKVTRWTGNDTRVIVVSES